MYERATRPVAIGLLRVRPGTSRAETDKERIAVALRANEEGYALVDVLEIHGDESKDQATYEAVEALGERVDAQAVLVSGDVDRTRLATIAERVRMVVLT